MIRRSCCNGAQGYKNVSQWEEHIRSYAHNHAKRKVELVQQQKAGLSQPHMVLGR